MDANLPGCVEALDQLIWSARRTQVKCGDGSHMGIVNQNTEAFLLEVNFYSATLQATRNRFEADLVKDKKPDRSYLLAAIG
jgi:hypothetical protein